MLQLLPTHTRHQIPKNLTWVCLGRPKKDGKLNGKWRKTCGRHAFCCQKGNKQLSHLEITWSFSLKILMTSVPRVNAHLHTHMKGRKNTKHAWKLWRYVYAVQELDLKMSLETKMEVRELLAVASSNYFCARPNVSARAWFAFKLHTSQSLLFSPFLLGTVRPLNTKILHLVSNHLFFSFFFYFLDSYDKYQT